MKQVTKHGVVLGIAAISAALAVSALVMNWESGPRLRNTAQSDIALKEGRAATATDPAAKEASEQKAPAPAFPTSLLD
jgi:hypothetical protein